MSYTLIGSERSPFVRLCRMLMIQNSIPFEFRILNFVDDKAAAEALAQETPINKVPILIDGSQKIFDSRVIVHFLTEKHKLRRLSIAEENFATAVYSCLDTGVLLFLMKRDGYDFQKAGFYMQRNLDRIPRNLEYLAEWAEGLDPQKTQDWNYASMGLFSFFYWAQAREVLKAGDYPRFTGFLQRFAEAPGVKVTTFDL